MATRGLTFLMLGAAWYVLALATQIGWLYLFCALTWSMGAVSILFAWRNLAGIELARTILSKKRPYSEIPVPSISEDEDLEIAIVIKNKGLLPKHLLRLTELCPLAEPGQQTKSFFLMSLAPRKTATVAYRVTCYRRGEFTFPPVVVETSGPFGLLKLRKEFPAPLALLVYPACLPLSNLPLGDAAWSKHGLPLKARAGDLFYGSREYQQGDSLRHIHWRNTARRSTLMVKEFEETTMGSLVITFDAARDFGEGKETTLEYAVKIAASVAKFCASQGTRVSLLPGQNPFSATRGRLVETMEFLARLKPGMETNLRGLLSLPRLPYPVLAIASLADPRQLAAMQELSTKVGQLIVVALAGFAEDELPEEALAHLRGNGTTVIPCHRGGLQAALKELESLNRQAILANVSGGPR
jgi:uncharacterized protein (DUF58 family)